MQPTPSEGSKPPVTACVNCQRPMDVLTLATHYGRSVDIDLCGDCHLVWFDGLESVNLSGRGVLELLRAINSAHGKTHQPLAPRPACPRCRASLKWAHNIANHGPTGHHECARGHGALQPFSLYLAEKGLVRPLMRSEVEQLRTLPAGGQGLQCLNCGAPVDPRERQSCRWCESPLSMVDVRLLMKAVDRHTGVAEAVGAAQVPRQRQLSCRQCGGSIDPTRERSCGRCAMPVVITDLAQAMALIEEMVPAVDRAAQSPEVRLRRIDQVMRELPAQRKRRMFIDVPWWARAGGALLVMAIGYAITWGGRD